MNLDHELFEPSSIFFSFKKNYLLETLMRCNQNFILITSGNQAGKTASVVFQYILRIFGLHPLENKNLRPDNPFRIIRMCSEVLPMAKEGQAEVKNTIYPQLKKFLPPSLIKRDITFRSPVVTVMDPQGGPDIYFEFTSYGQDVQAQAGVQRFSIYEDEEPPESFNEEQIPRLYACRETGYGGDLIIGCTPVQGISWMYEKVYQRAGTVYNSPTIISHLKEAEGIVHKPIERTGGNKEIAVIHAATDDNPLFTKENIDLQTTLYDDWETVQTRRYGIFHRISGTILKGYDPSIHFISKEKYFPDGIPAEWIHARGIDFHEHTNWAIGWIALDDCDEAFVWQEYNPSPDRFVALQICKEIARRSRGFKFRLDLIDPLAAKNQPSVGTSCLDDINRYFKEFKKFGIDGDTTCTGGNWETWDTKSLRGRDIVKQRILNSRIVGRPFNNRINDDGEITYLPTLWVLDTCPITNYMMKNWTWEQWASRESRATKDEKNKPEDKNSHFPIMIECVFKDERFRVRRWDFRDRRRSPYDISFRARV